MCLGPWAMGLTGLGTGLGLVFMGLGWAALMILEPMANTAVYVPHRSLAAGICRPATPPPSVQLLNLHHGCK